MVAISNPNIPLAVKNFSIADAVQQGRENKRRNKLLDLAIESKEDEIDRSNAQFDIDSAFGEKQADVREAAEIALRVRPLLDDVKSSGMAIQTLQEMGTPKALQLAQIIQSGNIDKAKAATEGALAVAERFGIIEPDRAATSASAKLGTSVLGEDAEGNPAILSNVLSPTGEMSAEITSAPGFSVTDRQGRDAQDRVGEAGSTAGAQTRAREVEARNAELITQGQEVADTAPVLRRTLDLLNTVSTGGVLNQAQLKFAQTFGIETADQGELSGLLGKAVLSQLRQTFGAQFTEQEGERLASIEAGFGKNNETNKRLLKQALEIVEFKARRAAKIARAQGDIATAQIIEDALEFELAPQEQETQSTKVGRFTIEVVK